MARPVHPLRAPLRAIATVAGTAGRWTGIALIWGYRLLLKPLFPATCRFEPSCSEYALIAVKRFGLVRGSWLAGGRLLRCNPWGPWGLDPVPEARVAQCHHHHRTGHLREHP